jgi:hypothetical protein
MLSPRRVGLRRTLALSAVGRPWVRRRFLEELLRVHQAGKLQFFGGHEALADARAFTVWIAPLRKCE